MRQRRHSRRVSAFPRHAVSAPAPALPRRSCRWCRCCSHPRRCIVSPAEAMPHTQCESTAIARPRTSLLKLHALSCFFHRRFFIHWRNSRPCSSFERLSCVESNDYGFLGRQFLRQIASPFGADRGGGSPSTAAVLQDVTGPWRGASRSSRAFAGASCSIARLIFQVGQ